MDFRLTDEQNGVDAEAALRAPAKREVPAGLVTGDTDPARVRAAYASGLSVTFKPVQPEVLLQTLRSLIRSDPSRK